jgi:hypothetical protein
VADVIKEFQGYSKGELLDEGKETISTAAAAECKALTNVRVYKIYVTNVSNAESIAGNVALATSRVRRSCLNVMMTWEAGLEKVAAQNFACSLTYT